MRLIKCLLAALAGAVAASIICWGGLYLVGVFVLDGHGSLFDTNPSLANTFFIAWGVLSAPCAAVGVFLTIRKSRPLH
jgi:hypothetical protein